MPQGDSTDQQKILTILAEIDEIEQKTAEAEKEAQKIRLEVGMTICRIADPDVQRILMLYYLENKSWQEIVHIMQYSRPHIYRYQYAGYEEIEKILNNDALEGRK